MGRSPCCDKVGLKKGPWTPEEDQKLLAYIEEHGHGSWRALPTKAGLQRCGKSCRLRWTNYLRPDIKRGKFSLQEEQTIIQLHALLGNRWSAIATHLPKRTDNEIKNYWNTHLKKRLAKMGIDPVTHKPKNDLLSSDGQSKNAANLSHMAQWESARLEAEARLVRESKLRSHSFSNYVSSTSATNSTAHHHQLPRSWNGVGNLESPTSTLTSGGVRPENTKGMIEFVGSSSSSETRMVKEEGENDWKGFGNSTNLNEYEDGLDNSLSFTSGSLHHDMSKSMEGTWNSELRMSSNGQVIGEEGFTSLLLNNSDDRSFSDGDGSDSHNGSGDGSEQYQDNENYWNSILNLVNSSPSGSPMF